MSKANKDLDILIVRTESELRQELSTSLTYAARILIALIFIVAWGLALLSMFTGKQAITFTLSALGVAAI